MSLKTIQVNGQPIKLNIVKPQGAQGTLPVFMFFHGGGWILGDFPTTNVWCAIWWWNLALRLCL